MNERYWIEQVAQKDKQIQELTDKLVEYVEYKGRYIEIVNQISERVEGFEELLTEEE